MDEGEIEPVQYCYYPGNVSCIKEPRALWISVILYVLTAVVVMLTFCGNLVVIISISHFKQLHTPTNILVLSLAIADFLVGVVIMPFMVVQSVDTCWYFGSEFCVIYSVLLCLLTETSIVSLVMIAVDRYIAICYPLLYSSKITVRIVSVSVGVVWLIILIYVCGFIFLGGNTEGVIGIDPCPGDCLLVLSSGWGTVDLVLSFLLPVSVMVTLYSKIFFVARRHARAISVQQNISLDHSNIPKKSERKAAKTLGIVVAVFILCWLPFYTCTLLNQFINFSVPSVVSCAFLWLAYINSSINPVIYALFYPWFQKSLKLMMKFKICSSGSSNIKLVAEI
uniref:G-protein coupled receptors family 1 profile domain-containing protein n=1 Tax=Erpetoichthys calabaricus TaxID=27687 RepID=A0A8C4X3Y5_ERPCA